MTISLETLSVDDLPLTNSFTIEEMEMPPPRLRPQWTQTADTDGAALVPDPPYENRTITAKLRPRSTGNMDAGFDAVGQLQRRLDRARVTEGGIPMVWSPAHSGRVLTFYCLTGEVTELPKDAAYDAGQSPGLTVEFICRPFGYGQQVTSLLDNLTDADVLSRFSADNAPPAGGSGQLSDWAWYGGLVLNGSSAATPAHRLVREGTPTYYDQQAVVRVVPTAVDASFEAGVMLKRRINTDQAAMIVTVFDDGIGCKLRVLTGDANGIVGAKVSGYLSPRPQAGTAFWLIAHATGDQIQVSYSTVVPLPTTQGFPAGFMAVNFTGYEAELFGAGRGGQTGLVGRSSAAGLHFDAFQIHPNVYVADTPALITNGIYGIEGDVPGEGELTFRDGAGEIRRWVEWGAERPPHLFSPLFIDSDYLNTTGYSGARFTIFGFYDSTSGVSGNGVASTVYLEPTYVCGLGPYPHTGRYRVKLVGSLSKTTSYVRISYRDGGGTSFRPNEWVAPVQGSLVTEATTEFDLGIIDLPPSSQGLEDQQWEGRIEGYAASGADTLAIDYILLIPVDAGYGKARSAYRYLPGGVVARHNFDDVPTLAALNGRTATSGGTWSTWGVSGDFLGGGPPNAGQVFRNTSTESASIGRYATLGPTTRGEVEVSYLFKWDTLPTVALETAAIARYVDGSNYISGIFSQSPVAGQAYLGIGKLVAGVASALGVITVPYNPGQVVRLHLVVYATGLALAFALDVNAPAVLGGVAAIIDEARLGNALQTGVVGFWDRNQTAFANNVRRYDNFTAGQPEPEVTVLNPAQEMKIRHNEVIRRGLNGSSWGRVDMYRGRQFFPAPSDVDDRPLRILARASQWDLEKVGTGAGNAAHRLWLQVGYTPRWLVVPTAADDAVPFAEGASGGVVVGTSKATAKDPGSFVTSSATAGTPTQVYGADPSVVERWVFNIADDPAKTAWIIEGATGTPGQAGAIEITPDGPGYHSDTYNGRLTVVSNFASVPLARSQT